MSGIEGVGSTSPSYYSADQTSKAENKDWVGDARAILNDPNLSYEEKMGKVQELMAQQKQELTQLLEQIKVSPTRELEAQISKLSDDFKAVNLEIQIASDAYRQELTAKSFQKPFNIGR
jgi:hypothetical protein